MNSSLATAFAKYPALKLLPEHRRILLPIIICILFFQSKTREITLSVLSDAFWQVSVFVAMTLTVYHLFADKINCIHVNDTSKNKVFKEIITASFMGTLPGCGGAIVVITQYVNGRMSFGAVAAVLTATMGDAAFLLLAAEPITGIGIVALCFVVGIISGVTVNKIHGSDFLRHTTKKPPAIEAHHNTVSSYVKYQGVLWQWALIPGAVIALLIAGQVDIAEILGTSENVIQCLGAAITLCFIILWSLTNKITNYESIVSEDKKTQKNEIFQKVALDTNFVTSWVVVAFIIFELFMLYTNLQLDSLFNQLGATVPLMGVIVGMIPGCGPQIVTTSLYLSGAIPLSAQIGNAISNDGDALFPAIALSPKVALVATAYSSVPAIITAYGYFLLFE